MKTSAHISNTNSPVSRVNYPSVKSTTSYVADVLTEGLKQNFLGADINMEFLVLTIRVMASKSIKTINQHVVKPLAAKTRMAKQSAYNQPAY